MTTEFFKVYNCFYSKITDDMYMELDQQQTEALLGELLLNALPWFEFPRVNINDFDLEKQCFNVQLSYEEINIIATYMIVGWFDQQLASVEVARMKYSGSDFKFTSQANHMTKLLQLKKDYERTGFHLQRLYKRRKADKSGIMRSTLGELMQSSVRNGIVSTNSSASNNPNTGVDKDYWEDMSDLENAGESDDGWADM